jgi:urease accessory protein UreF
MLNNNFKIAKDIVASYEARIKVVQVIAEDTKRLLEEFREKRERMGQELKEALAKHESLRKKDFDKMMGDILIAQSEREENVKKMLADFQKQEMAVVENLREMLKKGEKLRLKDFKKTLSKIREEQEIREKETPYLIGEELIRMQSEVREMLENFKRERGKAASEWKSMMTTMAKKNES